MIRRLVLGLLASLALQGAAAAAEPLKMSVTTSFSNSGLAEILLPEIKKDLDIEVQLIVVGTGQALKLGEAGDVDAVLVHSKEAEEAFVKAGHAAHRREIMYNDFVIVGPSADPAKAGAAKTAAEALKGIAAAGAPFVSRGDDSGTHKSELALWKKAETKPEGEWYRAVGQGMGAALNTASAMNAYILSDRASWMSFKNKGGLKIILEGDPALFNQYAYLPINPALHPHVKAEAAAKLEAWLASDRAKALIEGYKIDGKQLFVFNAKR